MAFQFRFASILMLRRQQRDEAGGIVGKANEAIERIDQQAEAIDEQRKVARSESHRIREGSVSVDQLLTAGRYEMQLDADLQSLAQTRTQLVQELERRQQLLGAAEAEVKRFEKLEENERIENHAEMTRREQAELDEVTASRFAFRRDTFTHGRPTS